MNSEWWPLPKAGEFVWCNFPDSLPLVPNIKPRPALILTVYDDEAPHYHVEVVYGTSQKTDRLLSGEFLISQVDKEAYQLSGLSFTTKFNFKNTVVLPYNSVWFKVPPKAPFGRRPKLGLLHPSFIRKVEAAYRAAN